MNTTFEGLKALQDTEGPKALKAAVQGLSLSQRLELALAGLTELNQLLDTQGRYLATRSSV